MFGNLSFSGKKTSPKSRFNSTLPAFVTSPISTRRRQPDPLNQTMQPSVLSAAGPPLSSPFMPQIKRALGLEPGIKRSYGGIQRRHSFNVASLKSSNCLPHVVLNKSRPLPLTERNSSMLRRSSTVRIAPPTPGKIASPSLYQMRNNSVIQEDRSTPDTYAVVSALKERRKRSITNQEDVHEVPVQHAKRRRQESQQSNASTSSMPSMPDNLPDLSNTDFTIRIETPTINRPSRPSQDDTYTEWEPDTSLNLTRQDSRNNSILSSLSSTRRSAMRSKRSAEMSILENDRRDRILKAQRRDPPKLSHFDSPMCSSHSPNRLGSVQNGPSTSPLTNGHVEATLPSSSNKANDKIPQAEEPVGKPTTNKPLPFLKRKTSVYSALNPNASFRKAQYANVYATLEDYDLDKQAENRRVQQMLNDVDKSFVAKETEKPAVSKSSDEKTSTSLTVQSASSVSSTGTTTTTTSVSISATSTSGPTLTLGGIAAATTQSVPKSPIQEVGNSKVSVTTTSSSSSVISANKNLSALLTESSSTSVTSSSVLTALTTLVSSTGNKPAETASLGTVSSIGNFSFGTNLVAAGSGQVSSAQIASSTGQPGGIGSTQTSTNGTGLNAGLGVSTSASSNKPAIGGFSFGSGLGSTTASPKTVVGFGLASNTSVTSSQSSTPSVTSQQAPVTGLGYGTAATSSSASSLTLGGTSQTSQASGFNFGASTTTTSTSALSFGLSSKPASATAPGTSVSGAFSFGGVSSAPSQPSSGFSFGSATTSASSKPGGFTFNTTSTSAGAPQPTGGFNFAPTTSTATPGGFNFNAIGSTSAAMSNAIGLAVGGVQVQTGSAPPAYGSLNTTQTATPSTGFGGFTTPAGTQPASTGFSFGSGSTNPVTNSTPAFGSLAQTTTSSNAPFAFGGTPTTTASSTPAPFTFNSIQSAATTSGTPFAFNAGVTKTTAATPFTFNAGQGSTTAASSATTGFNFGQQAASTTASTGTFQFGGSNTSTTGFAFGSTNQPPAFGSSTNQTPAFGSTTNQAPAFGSTNQTPAFGTTNPAPAFGSTNQAPAFGSTIQAPAFGSTNQTPAFGSTNQTPAFGSTTQASVFGAPSFGAPTQNQSSTSSVFGAPASTQPSTSSLFGTSTNNSNSSAFGSNTGTVTGFGKSHSMPSFGSNPSSNTGTFNFGQPAPNVNPFGQGPTTPAKQTGSAFGTLNTDSTPKNQTGSVFAFGQTNNDSAAKKGFDFSASAGGGTPNTGGFNFAAAASSTPVFNFGATAATPNNAFATPTAQASFSVGTADKNRPPRPIAKGRRRGVRR